MAETFFSPCPRGLEALLAEELVTFGARAARAVHGGVSWEGDWDACRRANLESRLATRVLWRVGQGRYRAEVDIYKLAYSVTWAKWFTADDTIRIYVTAQKSPLKSLEFITLRVKDAVCDHFRTVAGRRPNVDTADPAVRIHLFLTVDTATLYVDTTGEPARTSVATKPAGGGGAAEGRTSPPASCASQAGSRTRPSSIRCAAAALS